MEAILRCFLFHWPVVRLAVATIDSALVLLGLFLCESTDFEDGIHLMGTFKRERGVGRHLKPFQWEITAQFRFLFNCRRHASDCVHGVENMALI